MPAVFCPWHQPLIRGSDKVSWGNGIEGAKTMKFKGKASDAGIINTMLDAGKDDSIEEDAEGERARMAWTSTLNLCQKQRVLAHLVQWMRSKTHKRHHHLRRSRMRPMR